MIYWRLKEEWYHISFDDLILNASCMTNLQWGMCSFFKKKDKKNAVSSQTLIWSKIDITQSINLVRAIPTIHAPNIRGLFFMILLTLAWCSVHGIILFWSFTDALKFGVVFYVFHTFQSAILWRLVYLAPINTIQTLICCYLSFVCLKWPTFSWFVGKFSHGACSGSALSAHENQAFKKVR
jgi:hypothetical protein